MFFGATCQQYTLQLANEALHQSISPTTNNTFSYPRLWFPKLTKVQLSMACSTVKMATFLFGLAPGFSFISLRNCAAFCFRHINSDVDWRSEPVWYEVTYNDIQPWEALGRAEYQILQAPAYCNYYYWFFVELSTAMPRDIDIHPKSSRCSPIWISGQLCSWWFISNALSRVKKDITTAD